MTENSNKELNLLELLTMFFNWIKNVFIKLFQLIGNSLKLLYRHKVITILSLVFCILCGLYLSRTSTRKYEADVMAILNGASAQTVKEISKQIEINSNLNSETTLASKLSLPDSIANNILSIESFYVIDYLKDSIADVVDFKHKHPLTDTLNVRMPNRLYFRVTTKAPSQLPKFEQAFLNFFNNNEKLTIEFKTKEKNLNKRIELVDTEIHRMDSMASLTYFRKDQEHIEFRQNTLLVGNQYKQLFYRELLFLQNQKIKMDAEYAYFTEPLVLTSSFILNPVPMNGRIKYLVISILIGVGISILLSLFIENIKNIHRYLSSK